MLHQAAMLIIFFIAAVPKDSQRFSKAVCKHESFLCHLLPVGQWQSLRQHGKRTATKNGIAKVMRQANAQNPAKRLRHKNTAQPHRSHHFYSVSFWLCRTCRKGWSLSIFCCILFFITIKIYHDETDD